MKKLFVFGLMMTALLTVQAQLKVTPTLQKGIKKTYAGVAVMNLPGQKPITMNSEMTYTVTEATAEGYVVDMVCSNITSDVTTDNLAGQLIVAAQEMSKGITFRLTTDKNGKVTGVKDFAALSKVIDAQSDQFIETLFQKVPQLGQAIPKDKLKQQLLESYTEENMVKSINNASSVMALNGKTIMTGAQETFANEQGMKMKRMYFVNGKSVTSSSSIDMTKEEIKNLIIAQVEKMAPEQANMVKQNIDQLMASGMFKMEQKETATYELQDDGWVKSLTVDNNTDSMGQQLSTKTTVTIK
jgi:hypothetical protein